MPASTSVRCTHSRRAVSVRSRSLATWAMLRSPTRQRRAASALKAGVNVHRNRYFLTVFACLSMEHSWRAFSPNGVSTKSRQAHPSTSAAGAESSRATWRTSCRDRRAGCERYRVWTAGSEAEVEERSLSPIVVTASCSFPPPSTTRLASLNAARARSQSPLWRAWFVSRSRP